MCDECYEKVDKYGVKIRYKKGSYHWHCLTEPAMIYPDGDWSWYKDNKAHRENGPAAYWNGQYYFFLEGEKYNEENYWKEIKKYRKDKLKDL